MRRGRSQGAGSILARVPTLHFDSVLDGINDGSIREFLKGPEAAAIRSHSVEKNGVPHLAGLVTHSLEPSAKARIDGAGSKKESGWRSLFKVAPLAPQPELGLGREGGRGRQAVEVLARKEGRQACKGARADPSQLPPAVEVRLEARPPTRRRVRARRPGSAPQQARAQG